MSRIKKVALLIEALVAFSPAWLLVLLFWLPGFFINLRGKEQSLGLHLERGILLLAALAGVAAACALLTYIAFGKRILSPPVVVAFSGAGLLLSAWATAGFFGSSDLSVFALIAAAPLMCGLHLLYLGRSYFATAKETREPTR